MRMIRSAASGIGGESCEQFEYPGQVGADAVVIELPSGNQVLLPTAGRGACRGTETVDGLRRAEPQQRLHIRRRHRTVDEFLDQRGAALSVQLVGGDAFEGSLRRGRCGEKGVEDSRISRPSGPGGDLTSKRVDGGGHAASLRRPSDRNNRNKGWRWG